MKFEKAEIVQIFLVHLFSYPTLFIECLPIVGTVKSAVIKIKSLPLWNSAERQRNECPSGEMEKSLKGEGVGVWRPESFSEKLALQQRAEGNVR